MTTTASSAWSLSMRSVVKLRRSCLWIFQSARSLRPCATRSTSRISVSGRVTSCRITFAPETSPEVRDRTKAGATSSFSRSGRSSRSSRSPKVSRWPAPATTDRSTTSSARRNRSSSRRGRSIVVRRRSRACSRRKTSVPSVRASPTFARASKRSPAPSASRR